VWGVHRALFARWPSTRPITYIVSPPTRRDCRVRFSCTRLATEFIFSILSARPSRLHTNSYAPKSRRQDTRPDPSRSRTFSRKSELPRQLRDWDVTEHDGRVLGVFEARAYTVYKRVTRHGVIVFIVNDVRSNTSSTRGGTGETPKRISTIVRPSALVEPLTRAHDKTSVRGLARNITTPARAISFRPRPNVQSSPSSRDRLVMRQTRESSPSHRPNDGETVPITPPEYYARDAVRRSMCVLFSKVT